MQIMARILILKLAIIIIIWQNCCSATNSFVIKEDPLNIVSPLGELGIGLYSALAGQVAFDLRQSNAKAPGDYFRHPLGADTISLSLDDRKEILSLIKSNISPAYYDSIILEQIAGFKYRLGSEKDYRREYFIRYAKGDTTYVISGWLGKFLSFYRAVPGNIKYSIDKLQTEVQVLSPSYAFAPDDSFKVNPNGSYFLEYVDRRDLIRIRGYLIGEQISVDKETGYPIDKPYSLIEITKFIDMEMMP